jgi:hypothetical protein
MIVLLSIYVMGIVGFLIHLYTLDARSRTYGKVIELLLLYQIVFSLGLTSILSFFGLTFMADYIAKYTGWPASPFEQQLANVNLAFGVLGILCIWLRGGFWIATILGFSIWILGDGVHHFTKWLLAGNNTPGNIGVPLYTDIVIPILLLVLLYLHLRLKRKFVVCE